MVTLGGTMRLGSYPCTLLEGTKVREIYGEEVIHERHRHRYEVNIAYRDALEKVGYKFSGLSPMVICRRLLRSRIILGLSVCNFIPN